MPSYGTRSMTRLMTCDPRIQLVMNEVIKHINCTIICGHRNKADQDAAFADKKSGVQWPNSNHNKEPSLAVDAAVWNPELPRIRWEDRDQLALFAGYVLATADALSDGTWTLRCGLDWDRDWQVHDTKFYDAVHFEIKEL